MKKLSKHLAGYATAIVVGGLSVGVASAAIPDGSGVIHGCYDNKGALRIIDDSTTTCKSQETTLNWSQSNASGGDQALAYGQLHFWNDNGPHAEFYTQTSSGIASVRPIANALVPEVEGACVDLSSSTPVKNVITSSASLYPIGAVLPTEPNQSLFSTNCLSNEDFYVRGVTADIVVSFRAY